MGHLLPCGKGRKGRGVQPVTAQQPVVGSKTWATEHTSFQNEIVGAALAHAIGGKVEQAYRGTDMFEKRRRLMQQWATFCASVPAQENVTPLRRTI